MRGKSLILASLRGNLGAGYWAVMGGIALFPLIVGGLWFVPALCMVGEIGECGGWERGLEGGIPLTFS
jgi:hypothetical protein